MNRAVVNPTPDEREFCYCRSCIERKPCRRHSVADMLPYCDDCLPHVNAQLAHALILTAFTRKGAR